MSLIIPSNSIVSGGSGVANSLRFNDGSSDNLSRSTGTPSSRQKFTFSTWIKLSSVSGNRSIFNIETDGNTTLFFMVKNGDQLHFVDYNSSAEKAKLTTTAVYRDPSAWYHVVLRLDSTQGTNTNRCRLYVNGSEVTSFSATVYPSQNYNFTNNVGNTRIGVSQGNANYWDGYMAETVYCDGQSLAPDQFGEFDEDSGIWKPIDVSGLTFGTNGFYLDFENSGALGADVSGESNNFTVNNLTAIDQTTDTCTNNFATFNPLGISRGQLYSEGNTNTRTVPNAAQTGGFSTIGVSSGKWFAEFQLYSFNTNRSQIGIADDPVELDRTNTVLGESTYSVSYLGNNGNIVKNSSAVGSGSSYTTNDIIGVALNLDDNNILFYKNGVVQNSGTAISITSASSTPTGFYFFQVGDSSASFKSQHRANFGNPSIAISSGNTDGNGYGNFEYAVPSGYYSLNTKNLAEFG